MIINGHDRDSCIFIFTLIQYETYIPYKIIGKNLIWMLFPTYEWFENNYKN